MHIYLERKLNEYLEEAGPEPFHTAPWEVQFDLESLEKKGTINLGDRAGSVPLSQQEVGELEVTEEHL